MKTLEKSWNTLLGKPLGDLNYWVDKKRIPLGTLKPYELYDTIPEEDIVSIPFDSIDTPVTSRRALNILILAGSGDGKSMLMKVIWSVLANAKYYCGYIDPKSTDSGRARKAWHSQRIPINMKPQGIPLQHFVPVWALNKMQHLEHNFRKYSTSLEKVSEREMWQGLGMTNVGASRVARIIKQILENKQKPTLAKLKQALFELNRDELPEQSMNAVLRVITDVEDYQVIDSSQPELNMYNEWQQGYSVCISYNSASRTLMTFDIGQKIRESAQLYFQGNRNPIMWFLDDGGFFAKDFALVKYNFAKEEIIEIGNNYRSLGVNNVLAVQSLGIIDENVAETYRIKIISPLFNSVDSLSSINIPQKAIRYLRENILVKDRKKYLMQFLLIDQDNEVTPFFPFTPPCNHFTEVYHEKEGDSEC